MQFAFNGSTDSVGLLSKLVDNGHMIAGSKKGSASRERVTEEMREADIMRKVFYAVAIPDVWTGTGQHPVVVDAGGCGGPGMIPEMVDPRYGEISYSCYENRGYFLVGAKSGQWGRVCAAAEVHTIDPCHLQTFSGLNGLATLDGKAWGGITHEEIIIG
jgi:hypothetical protein